MKIGIISAAVAAVVLLLVGLVAPVITAAVLMALLSAASVYEFGRATGASKYMLPFIISLLFALYIPMWAYFGGKTVFLLLGIIVFVIVQSAWLMIKNTKPGLNQVAVFLLASVLIPFAFAVPVKLALIGRGQFLLPFVLAFVSDAGAYFVGTYLGKHQALPELSPKKTYEGIIGGLLASCIAAVIFCFIVFLLKFRVAWLGVIVYGILCSAISQFGGSVFTCLKRHCGVPSFGKLIPGLGGILDRVDSVIFCAPFTMMLLLAMPLFS
ncbi:MAG: phosphatidate cytidylyltransferase [Oscillospiraceae bacterium]|nr:phosphatidate cytidylyltransferase [Oscillospiraceae bacterium]